MEPSVRKDYLDSEPLVAEFFAARQTFRTRAQIVAWFCERSNRFIEVPPHEKCQCTIQVHSPDAIDFVHYRGEPGTEVTVAVRIYALGTDMAADPSPEPIYACDYLYDMDYDEWPFIVANVAGTYVATVDAPGVAHYFPAIDHFLNRYAPIHFPLSNLQSLVALRDNEFLCTSLYQGEKIQEVQNLLFDTRDRAKDETVGLPEDLSM